MTQYNCNDASNSCIVQLQIHFSCLFMIIMLGTVSFLCLCLFWHLFFALSTIFQLFHPPNTLLSAYYYQIFCMDVVVIHVLSICLKICEKDQLGLSCFLDFCFFLPIFSIFQCIPPLMQAVTLIPHTFTYHTEHVITLKQHLLMFYFV